LPERRAPDGSELEDESDADDLSSELSSESEIYTPAPTVVPVPTPTPAARSSPKKIYKRQNSFGKSIALAKAYAFGNLSNSSKKESSKKEPVVYSQPESQQGHKNDDEQVIYKQPRPQGVENMEQVAQTSQPEDDGIAFDYLEVEVWFSFSCTFSILYIFKTFGNDSVKCILEF